MRLLCDLFFGLHLELGNHKTVQVIFKILREKKVYLRKRVRT